MLSFLLSVVLSGACTAVAFAGNKYAADPVLRRTRFGRWVAVPLDFTWGWVRRVTGEDWLARKLDQRRADARRSSGS